MALLRPSLTLVLDLDERVAAEQTILEINRSYAQLKSSLYWCYTDTVPVETERLVLLHVEYHKVRKKSTSAEAAKKQVGA